MLLEEGGEVHAIGGRGAEQNALGQEHPRGIPPDAARPDQALADGQQVCGTEVAVADLTEGRVPPDEHPAQFALERPELRIVRLGLGGGCAPLPAGGRAGAQTAGAPLDQLAVDGVPGGNALRVAQDGRTPGHRPCFGGIHAARHGRPVVSVGQVRQEHLRRVAIPHLQRVYVHPVPHVVDVEEHLRRIADAGDGTVRVPAAGQGEVGDCVQLEEVRARGLEEGGQQLVGGPLAGQRRQVVEHVERARPVLVQGAVHGAAEPVEPEVGIDGGNGQAGLLAEDGGVRGKAKVDDRMALSDPRGGERGGKVAVFVLGIHLPDHVVAQTELADEAIQGRYPAAYCVLAHPSPFSLRGPPQ